MISIIQGYSENRIVDRVNDISQCMFGFKRLKVRIKGDNSFTSSVTCSTIADIVNYLGDSVAEWLECWTRAQKGPSSNRSHDAVG